MYGTAYGSIQFPTYIHFLSMRFTQVPSHSKTLNLTDVQICSYAYIRSVVLVTMKEGKGVGRTA